jgi:hypothetical protein
LRLVRRFIGGVLGRLVLFRSHDFRITALDLVKSTSVLRSDASPFTTYLDWRNQQVLHHSMDFYQDHPVLWDIAKHFYGKIDRISLVASSLEASLGAIGDVAEFGVYRGHTAEAIKRTLDKHGSNKALYLFDSYAGMPDIIHPLDGDWEKGDLASGVEHVQRLFEGQKDVHIIPGYFSDTLPDHQDLKFSFCHVDADLYTSIKECIEFILPRLSEGGCIVFDDYGFRDCPGAKQAVEEALGADCQSFIPLPTGQAIYISRPWQPKVSPVLTETDRTASLSG